MEADRFVLLCKDGQRRPLSEYRQCNWGLVPSHALVTSSARTSLERKRYQQFLTRAVQLYSSKPITNVTVNDRRYEGYNRFDTQSDDKYYDQKYLQEQNYQNQQNQGGQYYNQYDRDQARGFSSNLDSGFTTERSRFNGLDENSTQPYEKFDIFESEHYGGRLNLMFQDAARNLVPIKEDDQSFGGYLGHALQEILEVRQCPVNRMTLCVTSDAEMDKCIKMRVNLIEILHELINTKLTFFFCYSQTALKAQLIKPEMSCFKGHSHINCMQSIQSGVADVTVLDASDVYTAGLRHELIPIISEVYNLGEPEYYVVAVAKEEDPSTELTYLKGKYTCHPGINTAAGWVYPMAYLISNGWIRPYGCDSVRAAAEYFTKSCIPGAISNEYNIGVPYDNMCDLCHGTSYR